MNRAEELFDVGFWPQVELGHVLLFALFLAVVAAGFWALKWWVERRKERSEAEAFLVQARKAGFTHEEYECAVDLVNEHHVVPPIRFLVSLRQFDTVATAEIEQTMNDTSLPERTAKTRVQQFYNMRRKLLVLVREEERGETPSA